MGQYLPETFVIVHPFIRQAEGEEILIGHIDRSTFLLLPPDAVELLDYLAAGKTVGEAQQLYQDKYNETPDLEDLLNYLELKEFVQPQVIGRITQLSAPNAAHRSPQLRTKRYHFSNFPQSLAQKLCSRSVLIYCVIFIGLALSAIAIDPSILPGWKAHFFTNSSTSSRLALIGISYVTLFFHEMAHLVAARAVGVSSQMGISHRIWFLVAETDMTGIWSIPRKQRYFPFIAGPLLDAVSASFLILILFAYKHGFLLLHSLVYQTIRAVLLIYILRLLWQCYFFVRTDFYFVIANIFHCKSLMQDTEVFLKNWLSQFIRSIGQVDQSHIPQSERQVICWYGALWIIGRIAALATLLGIQLPLMWNYGLMIFTTLSAGYQSHPNAFMDSLLMLLIFFIPQFIGFWLWIRSFRTTFRTI